MTQDLLLFDVAQRRFGIAATHIRQLVRAVAITSLPGASSRVEGVINYHGTIVPVIDLRGLLGLPAKPLELTDNLILLQSPAAEFAIRVDEAIDFMPVDDSALTETHFTVDGATYTRTIGKTSLGLICLLDVDQLLGPEEGSKLHQCLATSTQGGVHDGVFADKS